MSKEQIICFVAGEASGDNHGAALLSALHKLDPSLCFTGRGGPRMKAVAGDSFTDWSDAAAVVGLWEVLKRYGYFRKQFNETLREIARLKPSAVVLIDYPGFNLRLAKALRETSRDLKIIYYISPQVWAWNRSRIPKMARWLDLMLCIFPFEAELYEKSGLKTQFVGHPMLGNLEGKRSHVLRDPRLIGLFPGSREREVRKLLPVMIEVIRELHSQEPEWRFEVAAASELLGRSITNSLTDAAISPALCNVTVGEATLLMQQAALGIVASGTATLEAAYFRLPFVLVYKVALMTYLAGRLLIRVKHLGMPNILAGKEIVPEFIQGSANGPVIAKVVGSLMRSSQLREGMTSEFDKIITALGKRDASTEAAAAIISLL